MGKSGNPATRQAEEDPVTAQANRAMNASAKLVRMMWGTDVPRDLRILAEAAFVAHGAIYSYYTDQPPPWDVFDNDRKQANGT